MTRDERIRRVMENNKDSAYPFERTEGYAQAYVNGQMDLERKFKMTREEAINRISEETRKTGDLRPKSVINNDLIVLETLGLIKFDEPEKFIKFEAKVGDRVSVTLKMSDGYLHRYEGQIDEIRKPIV